MYVVYQKTYIERLGEKIDDEIHLWDSDSVANLIKLLKSKNVKASKSAIYKAINTKKPIWDEYYVYKIKM